MKTLPSPKLYKLVLNRYKDLLRENIGLKCLAKSKSSWPAIAESNYNEFCTQELPKQSQVVICGGGVVGCSVAYHLARDFGWKDVVLLEQSWLGGGTSKFGAGLLGQIKPTAIETKLCQYSIELYKTFAEQGLNTGFKGCGSLSLARTADRMTSFRHIAASAIRRHFGVFQSSKNIIDADSDDQNEIKNAFSVPPSSKMRKVMKSLRSYLDAHSNG
ncbi:pyruvate dehydrogenase phosphatase regulatory subunit, mitochondrial [Trichonephila clavipes]|nr:pyruvate dehydrogenase phosphatase regulatory subunit, mitochondrial [Trichonephila clavipes]